MDANVPQSPRLIRLPTVERKTGYKKSKIYKAVVAGDFPAPVKNGRSTFWIEAEIDAWICALISKARRAGVAAPKVTRKKRVPV